MVWTQTKPYFNLNSIHNWIVDSFLTTSYLFVCSSYYFITTFVPHIYFTLLVIYLLKYAFTLHCYNNTPFILSLQIDDVTSRKKDKYVAVIYTHLRFLYHYRCLEGEPCCIVSPTKKKYRNIIGVFWCKKANIRELLVQIWYKKS